MQQCCLQLYADRHDSGRDDLCMGHAKTGSGLTGGAAGTGSTINDELGNTLSVSQTASLQRDTNSGSCTGTAFTLTVTVNPAAIIGAQSTATCSTVAFSYTPTGTIAAGTTYAWGTPTTGSGLTGGAAGTGSTINDELGNTLSVSQTASYSVTPSSGSCTGTAFTLTVTVNPAAIIGAQSTATCSTVAFSYTPTGTIAAGTTYAWGTPIRAAG